MDYHALTAVDAFSSGRLLPLQENPQVHARRMALRRIGTKFEEKYATMTGPQGFTRRQRWQMHVKLLLRGASAHGAGLVLQNGPRPAAAANATSRARPRGWSTASSPPVPAHPAKRREVSATTGAVAHPERTIGTYNGDECADHRARGMPKRLGHHVLMVGRAGRLWAATDGRTCLRGFEAA